MGLIKMPIKLKRRILVLCITAAVLYVVGLIVASIFKLETVNSIYALLGLVTIGVPLSAAGILYSKFLYTQRQKRGKAILLTGVVIFYWFCLFGALFTKLF